MPEFLMSKLQGSLHPLHLYFFQNSSKRNRGFILTQINSRFIIFAWEHNSLDVNLSWNDCNHLLTNHIPDFLWFVDVAESVNHGS